MRWPVDKPRVTPHGSYGQRRTSRKFCGGKPPCTHHGLDLAGDVSDIVYAPETGILVYSFVGDHVKPFSRFGPAGIVIKGSTTGMYHLLMHMDAPTGISSSQAGGKAKKLPPLVVLEGTPVGRISNEKKHLHWEMRSDPRDRSTHANPLLFDPVLPDVDARAPELERKQAASNGNRGGVFAILILLAMLAR